MKLTYLPQATGNADINWLLFLKCTDGPNVLPWTNQLCM